MTTAPATLARPPMDIPEPFYLLHEHLAIDLPGARAVFTGNVGCLLQIGRHLRARGADTWVAHPVEALWASYSGELPHRAPGLPGAI